MFVTYFLCILRTTIISKHTIFGEKNQRHNNIIINYFLLISFKLSHEYYYSIINLINEKMVFRFVFLLNILLFSFVNS